MENVPAVKTELTFENTLMTAMRMPGVKINRATFLKKELSKDCPEDVVAEAIKTNPANAGISKDIINNVSIQVINYETSKVTALSVAASLPGGLAAVPATAADLASYFSFVLRILQELAYLYGFSQFDFKEDDIDSETLNVILIFMGVMFGVQGAAAALKEFAQTFEKHLSKTIAQKALTKGTLYPIIKKIAAKVGVRMTKQIFADTVASAVPVIGGVASGGLTFAMFRPGCMRLRKHLMTYNLCDPNFYRKSISPDSDFGSID